MRASPQEGRFDSQKRRVTVECLATEEYLEIPEHVRQNEADQAHPGDGHHGFLSV